MADKKYYWLKLDRNFFKRHDIQVIESQTNGKEYVLFYLKLLVESIDHEGSLRFNEFVPYDEVMLATITNTNIDIVRHALLMFESLEMIEKFDDKTIFIRHTQKMLGASKSTERVKRYRENQKTLLLANETQCNVTETVSETLFETQIEKEKELDIEKEKKENPQYERFDEFWKLYPKKVGKADARKSWMKIKPTKELHEQIINKVSAYMKSDSWKEQNGRFIPNPATWLNQGRWEDEIYKQKQSSNPFKDFYLKEIENEQNRSGLPNGDHQDILPRILPPDERD